MKRVTTKAIALATALLLLLSSLPVMSVFAAYENTYTNTGNQAVDIVEVAKTQTGYLEGSLEGTVAGSDNYQKFGKWYDANVDNIGGTYAAWCAMFVSWCANQAGIPNSTVYYHAYCPYGVTWFRDAGLWKYSASRGGSYTPKAGDIIYFAPSGSTVASHVGIVRYSSGGYVYTVEGNTSGQNGEVNEGGGVFQKSYELDYERIYGYGTPAYTDNSGSSAAKIGAYTVTASELNVRSGAAATYDSVGVVYEGDIVNVTELSSEGWGKITLANGTEGWCSITKYGNYIGVDALGNTISSVSSGVSYYYNADGSITINNNGTARGALDFDLPLAIGTATTPYLTCQMVPSAGGYFFGVTQANSGYFMMRDCQSGDELVAEDSAPYMTDTETLEINLSQWWKPDKDYQIDTVRMYLEPGASLKINYFYFAASAATVTDTTYNMHKETVPTITLMDPAKLSIADRTIAGGYAYDNGKLTVTAASDKGYTVVCDLNKDYQPESLPNLLADIASDTSFNISLLVTTKGDDTWFSLGSDFYPSFGADTAADYLPAYTTSASLNFVGCYTWNDALPTNGISTIKQIKISLGGQGSITVNALQMAADSTVVTFNDGVQKSDSTTAQTTVVLESDDYIISDSKTISHIGCGTTAKEMKTRLRSSHTIALYDGETAVSEDAVAKTGMVVKVFDGTTLVDSYTMAVKGDVTGTGNMGSTDVRVIMASLMSTGTPLTSLQQLAADYDSSGVVDTNDARNMLRIISAA